MNKHFIQIYLGLALVFSCLLVGCENQLEMTLPQGPQGPKGEAGLSAFELWKLVYGKDSNTTIEDFFDAIKGEKGDDGKTPTVEIGTNGNWFINGTDTGVLARGQNGQDGTTPTVEIGTNGNWFINGTDTGVLARGQNGQDGTNGKTSYELWKDAVNEGKMTNKDGSTYTGGNTWEDYLKWLQGGDVSVLHQYWTKLPGNEGKTIEQFITEMFDCHCDGITVGVTSYTGCVELDTDGKPKAYSAKIIITADPGTKVNIKNGEQVLFANQTIPTSGYAEFSIAQTGEAKNIDIICALAKSPNEQITKKAIIPALKYIAGATVVVENINESTSQVSITFEDVSPLSELLINGINAFKATIGTDNGWGRTNNNKTFTRQYAKTASEQTFSINAKGDNGECTELSFKIPQLTQVTISAEPTLSIKDDCTLTLTVKGTQGMTVTILKSGQTLSLTESETSPGTYTIDLPREYTAYTVNLTAKKDGFGTYTKNNISAGGSYLLIEPLTKAFSNVDNTTVKGVFTNKTNAPLTITLSRAANSNTKSKERAPWIQNNVTTYTIPAAGAPGNPIQIIFNKDYAEDLSTGVYKVTVKATNACDKEKTYTPDNINNQGTYGYGFRNPTGWNGGIGDPDDNISFIVDVTNSLPNKYVQLLLLHDGGLLNSVMNRQTDANGNLTATITMKRKDVQAALTSGKGYFKFSDDATASTVILDSTITFVFP